MNARGRRECEEPIKPRPEPANVIHEDADLAPLMGGVDQLLRAFARREVDSNCLDAPAVDELPQLRADAPRSSDDARALRDERPRDRKADALAGTSDYRQLVCQTEIHLNDPERRVGRRRQPEAVNEHDRTKIIYGHR